MPRHAQELRTYAGPAQQRAGLIRLRITVAGDLPRVERDMRVGDMRVGDMRVGDMRVGDMRVGDMRVGDVLLCATAGCYRAHTAGYVKIGDTSGGKAQVIADVAIPPVTISDVYFTEVAGASAAKGHLKLEPALVIEQDVPAVELMIALGKGAAGRRPAWAPVASAHMVFADDSEMVHYLPSVRTVAQLSLGTTLTLPAGALDRPRIFNVGIAKVGERFPRVDIFPYLGLKKPGELEVRSLGRGHGGAQAQVIPVGPAPDRHAAATQDAPAAQPSARLRFWRTAVIEPAVLERSLSAGAGTAPR